MRLFLERSATFLLIMSLFACSTNTQTENTGIGAVTGAVVGGLAGSLVGQGTGKVVAVGVGAVIGALVGGYVGKSMDSSDSQKTYSALDHNPTNKSTQWTNSKTGKTYTVTPKSNTMSYNGNAVCRQYQTTVTNNENGKSQTVSGTACRQSNGTWKEYNA